MSKVIALDAGHGNGTPGKRCDKRIDPNQTREWVLNDRIMDMVEFQLKHNYDCTVIRTDDTTGVVDVSLSKRVKTANNAKADLFISMHHNAGIAAGYGGGTVVYYYSSSASRKAQAQKLYDKIVAQTKLTGNRCNKVIKYAYYVLKNTTMPAFLVENGFMDSPTDVPIILSEEHAKNTANAVVDFIVETLSLPFKAGAPTVTTSESKQYYSTYIGTYNSIAAALEDRGMNSSYTFRKALAAANGITMYVGSYSQNVQLYNLFKAGLLKVV